MKIVVAVECGGCKGKRVVNGRACPQCTGTGEKIEKMPMRRFARMLWEEHLKTFAESLHRG